VQFAAAICTLLNTSFTEKEVKGIVRGSSYLPLIFHKSINSLPTLTYTLIHNPGKNAEKKENLDEKK
jgi:hypothetical protein